MTFGIDVSKWQGNFNFDRAKSEGVQFAILRGANSVIKDPKFEQFYRDCKQIDMPVGVYQYSLATTIDEAKVEANYLYDNVLKGKQFEYPIYLDVEDRRQTALSPELLTDIVCTWCESLESRGYFVGIYSGKYIFRENMIDERLRRYTHWVALWGNACTYDDKSVLGMWQFGGDTNRLRSNTVAGVVCDQDYAYVDFPAIIKARNLNGCSIGFSIGDTIRLSDDAKYTNGKSVPAWVKRSILYVRSTKLSNGSYNVSVYRAGAITGRVDGKYIVKI